MPAAPSTMQRRRRFWLRVHLWVALVAGAVVAVLGVSGSLLVLRGPILAWEVGTSTLRLAAPPPAGTPMATAQDWKDAAAAAYPQFARVMGAAAPRQGFLLADNALVFGPLKGRRAMGIATVDPYSGEPRGFFVFDDLWLAKIVALHRALLLPAPAGPVLVALSGLALLLSLATGAWLWWPRAGGWARVRAAATFSPASRGLRRWLELHNVAAVYLFVPLVVLAATGAWLARPGWFAPLGLGPGIKPVASALHAHLMLGTVGDVLVFLAGLALPVLYVSGLVLWWRRRRRPTPAPTPLSKGQPT